MGNGNPLIDLGAISKPATVLIEKISDAVGAIYRPRQIKRIAKAEAEAEKIRALADIEITEIQQRGFYRLIQEEGKKQENIENITALSLEDLKEDAKPQDMDNDWVANFFDKCKLVSDKEMQSLWARLLAGEANKPSTFSKRTVEVVATLDKSDAQLFTDLCEFGWFMVEIIPLIYDIESEVYNKKGINYMTLTHLDDIGLLSFNSLAGYVSHGLPKTIRISYYDRRINIEFQREENNDFNLGKAILTKTGKELAPICGSKPSEEFFEYVLKEWQKFGYITSSTLTINSNKADV